MATAPDCSPARCRQVTFICSQLRRISCAISRRFSGVVSSIACPRLANTAKVTGTYGARFRSCSVIPLSRIVSRALSRHAHAGMRVWINPKPHQCTRLVQHPLVSRARSDFLSSNVQYQHLDIHLSLSTWHSSTVPPSVHCGRTVSKIAGQGFVRRIALKQPAHAELVQEATALAAGVPFGAVPGHWATALAQLTVLAHRSPHFRCSRRLSWPRHRYSSRFRLSRRAWMLLSSRPANLASSSS